MTGTQKKPETKAEKFVRIAQQRTTKAVSAIRQIGNLGMANYQSTPAQREQLILALAKAVQDVKSMLNQTKPSKPDGFVFNK